ncbi:MAG TPA: endo-1,4-beta-xylanase, partial [Chitinophagaceae bacterium]|nr:endo-1,4-beta-xylanase [Chitinophagaceae bacterium]
QAGMAVYGHTLCWYQNNNGNYLRALLALPGSTPASNPTLISNGDFESGTAATISNTGSTYGGICTGWTGQVQGASVGALSITTAAGETYSGTRALKAVVTTPPANGYQYQAFPPDGAPTLTSGKSYRIAFYAKHTGATTPKIRVQTQNGGYQTNDVTVTTSWARYTCDLTPSGDATRFNFQFLNAGTFFIDSVTLTLTNPGTTAATDAEKNYRIDTTLKNFITAMVTRYKDKVHAWDVVNELFKDNGQYRNDPSSASDMFPWYTYLGGGDSTIIKAFTYAHAADPSALLFINDYNQEVSGAKTDSMVSVVNRLKKAGVPIDGIGVQMHIDVNTPNTGIDYALLKLASTGLKIRVSELDVRVNPAKTVNFVVTSILLAQQAAKYKYVVESFYRNVPAAQR